MSVGAFGSLVHGDHVFAYDVLVRDVLAYGGCVFDPNTHIQKNAPNLVCVSAYRFYNPVTVP